MRVISNEHHQKPALNRIQLYVVCNAKRNITLDDIARHVGMNRTPFCLFFKKAKGVSPSEYAALSDNFQPTAFIQKE